MIEDIETAIDILENFSDNEEIVSSIVSEILNNKKSNKLLLVNDLSHNKQNNNSNYNFSYRISKVLYSVLLGEGGNRENNGGKNTQYTNTHPSLDLAVTKDCIVLLGKCGIPQHLHYVGMHILRHYNSVEDLVEQSLYILTKLNKKDRKAMISTKTESSDETYTPTYEEEEIELCQYLARVMFTYSNNPPIFQYSLILLKGIALSEHGCNEIIQRDFVKAILLTIREHNDFEEEGILVFSLEVILSLFASSSLQPKLSSKKTMTNRWILLEQIESVNGTHILFDLMKKYPNYSIFQLKMFEFIQVLLIQSEENGIRLLSSTLDDRGSPLWDWIKMDLVDMRKPSLQQESPSNSVVPSTCCKSTKKLLWETTKVATTTLGVTKDYDVSNGTSFSSANNRRKELKNFLHTMMSNLDCLPKASDNDDEQSNIWYNRIKDEIIGDFGENVVDTMQQKRCHKISFQAQAPSSSVIMSEYNPSIWNKVMNSKSQDQPWIRQEQEQEQQQQQQGEEELQPIKRKESIEKRKDYYEKRKRFIPSILEEIYPEVIGTRLESKYHKELVSLSKS